MKHGPEPKGISCLLHLLFLFVVYASCMLFAYAWAHPDLTSMQVLQRAVRVLFLFDWS